MLLFNDALEDSVWEMFQFTPTNPSENQIPKSEQKVRRISTPFFSSFLWMSNSNPIFFLFSIRWKTRLMIEFSVGSNPNIMNFELLQTWQVELRTHLNPPRFVYQNPGSSAKIELHTGCPQRRTLQKSRTSNPQTEFNPTLVVHTSLRKESTQKGLRGRTLGLILNQSLTSN